MGSNTIKIIFELKDSIKKNNDLYLFLILISNREYKKSVKGIKSNCPRIPAE
jgi:hypothetical protein|tara:strand:- start:245 stop:400 length:156 start_codon:yes stop_codon:yes gene_type:complete